ncbi:MAG: FAD-binding oxidoreductase [Flavobacteriales bacterium]|nr:FAD-binding oxidoreductase [Flavobacteriales bacterium]MCB9364082.1 FAD-binding oxidoreductase [Flavobacteriales bacterium]
MQSKFSYWERNSFFNTIDLIIIGSGIVGLNTAIHYKKNNPKHKVLILERGILPNGASTKNAGFACFGSPSELLDDLSTNSENEVFSLVEKRWKGLQELRKLIGDENLDFQNNSGLELFTPSYTQIYETCLEKLDYLNKNLTSIVGRNTYSTVSNSYGFNNIIGIIKNQYEGQIDTGKMMSSLTFLAQSLGIQIINNLNVTAIHDNEKNVEVITEETGILSSRKVVVATNGFAKELLKLDVEPARAQVLITKPLNNLPFKGTFHYNKGYYYFRNIHNRVLFGGGRNLDFKAENTTSLENTPLIINELSRILKEVILPNTKYEIDYTWAGIMGVGNTKQNIVKQYSNNIICAVRMGGMGVAIGSLIGKEAAELLN